MTTPEEREERRGAILVALEGEQRTPAEIADVVGLPLATVYNDLRNLAAGGRVRMVGWTNTSDHPRRRARVWGVPVAAMRDLVGYGPDCLGPDDSTFRR